MPTSSATTSALYASLGKMFRAAVASCHWHLLNHDAAIPRSIAAIAVESFFAQSECSVNACPQLLIRQFRCFLQLRKPGEVRPPRCPFCNSQEYVVRAAARCATCHRACDSAAAPDARLQVRFWGPRSPETRMLESSENRRVARAVVLHPIASRGQILRCRFLKLKKKRGHPRPSSRKRWDDDDR